MGKTYKDIRKFRDKEANRRNTLTKKNRYDSDEYSEKEFKKLVKDKKFRKNFDY